MIFCSVARTVGRGTRGSSSSSRVNIPLKPMTHSSDLTHTIFLTIFSSAHILPFSNELFNFGKSASLSTSNILDKSRHIYIEV